MIVDVMEDNNIHVLSISETNLRQGIKWRSCLNNSNVAICFVYLAAEVGGDNFHVWNAELCAMLQAKITTLREDRVYMFTGRGF